MENTKELAKVEDTQIELASSIINTLDMPDHLKEPGKRAMQLVGAKAFEDQGKAICLVNLLSTLSTKLTVDNGKKALQLGQINNLSEMLGYIGNAALCKVSNTDSLYLVSYKTGGTKQGPNGPIQMYNVRPSLNYLEEERILKEFSPQ
jgi:hypothetical protein